MTHSLKTISIGIAIAGVLLLYYVFDARNGGFPACPFFSLTGWQCPGCGSQRGLSALLHGDIRQAISYNLLFAGALPLCMYVLFVYIKSGGTRRPLLLYHPFFPKISLFVILTFWMLRNLF